METAPSNLNPDQTSHSPCNRAPIEDSPQRTVLGTGVSDTSEAGAYFYLGDLLLHVNRVRDAEAYLGPDLELDPRLSEALTSMSLLDFRRGSDSEALGYLEHAVKTEGAGYLPHFLYGRALSSWTSERDLLGLGQIHLRKALELKPDMIDAYLRLGFALLREQESVEEASEVVGDVAELDVSTPEIVIARAILLWLSGNGTEARSILSALTRDLLDPAIRIQSEEILAEMDASRRLIPASPGESEVGSADPAIPH